MASKSIVNPFIVFKSLEDLYATDYSNFNGKYIIAVEALPEKWLFLNIDTYINNTTANILNLIKEIQFNYQDIDPFNINGFVYGIDYMFSLSLYNMIVVDDSSISAFSEDSGFSEGTGFSGGSDFSGGTNVESDDEENTDYLALPLLIVSNIINAPYYDRVKTENANKINLAVYSALNEVNTNKYTDEELASLCATFCNLIKTTSFIDDDKSVQNQIYEMVLNFYANEGTDDVLEKFALLSSIYTTNSSSSCGCTSVSSCTSTVTSSSSSTTSCDCASIYKTYIASTLKTMLGDSQFYKDWFVGSSEGESSEEINTQLCDDLIELLNEFINQGYDLDFSSSTSTSCPSVSSEQSECNYLKINNYIKVLELVRENNIDYNVNKIKSYGQQFGELLPNLMF